MAGEPGKTEVKDVQPDHAVWDMTAEDQGASVIRLGGNIVIDARDKPIKGYKHGYTNREELDRFNRVVGRVRRVAVSSMIYEKDVQTQRQLVSNAFINEMRNFGYKVNSAKVIGQMPHHWKPESGGIWSDYLYRPDGWREVKEELLAIQFQE